MTTVRIDDPGDPRLDDYRRLNDQRHRRRVEEDEQRFVAEGYVSIDRVIDSGHRLRSVLLAPSRVDRFRRHLDRLDADGVPVFVAEPGVIEAAIGFDLHRGVVASAERRPLHRLDGLAQTARRLVVLDGLNDPENVGVIARASRAFAADGLVLGPTCTDPYSRRTVRVSMGEVLHLPVCRVDDTAAALRRLADAGTETWAMTPSGDDDLWSCTVPDRLAIVLGAEGPGLPDEVMDAATRRVRIPIDPDVDSLNVGHAAAVTLAAVTRPS